MSREVARPLTLVFVRHGESEANVVQLADKSGDTSGYTAEMRKKANPEMQLTELGMEQAKAAGVWIRKNIQGGKFGEYYVSSFVRAIQTAAYLDLPEAEERAVWKIRDYLREQGFGHLDNMPETERWEKYPDIMARKSIDQNYWPGFGGESRANLTDRVKVGIVATVYRECAGGSGIVISHGNTMWAVRTILEGFTWEQLSKVDSRDNPLEKMNNCQVLQYTRIDPGNSSRIETNFSWMRTVCPWDESLSKNDWVEIKRPKYGNEDLLRMVEARIKEARERLASL